MKKLKIFLTLVILVEIFIMLLLINGISDKKLTRIVLDIPDADFPQHSYRCGTKSNNTKLMDELKPNCSTYFDGFKVKIPTTFIKINSDGFRDKEYSIEKPNNTFRVIVLGDSTTFGQGVNISDAYTEVLERKLNSLDNGITYEVLNFGVPGYNMLQKVEFFKTKGLKYAPDVIILHYTDDDVFNKTRRNEIHKDTINKYMDRGFNTTNQTVARQIFIETQISQWKEIKDRPLEEIWQIVEVPLKELHEITSEKNISVILLATDLTDADARQIPALRQLCEKYNWTFSAGVEYKLDRFYKEMRIIKDGHFNEYGNTILANAFYDLLLKRKLV